MGTTVRHIKWHHCKLLWYCPWTRKGPSNTQARTINCVLSFSLLMTVCWELLGRIIHKKYCKVVGNVPIENLLDFGEDSNKQNVFSLCTVTIRSHWMQASQWPTRSSRWSYTHRNRMEQCDLAYHDLWQKNVSASVQLYFLHFSKSVGLPGTEWVGGHHLHRVSRPIQVHDKQADWWDIGARLWAQSVKRALMTSFMLNYKVTFIRSVLRLSYCSFTKNNCGLWESHTCFY